MIFLPVGVFQAWRGWWVCLVFPFLADFFFFFVAVQAFCLSDGEELLGVLCSQEEARQ